MRGDDITTPCNTESAKRPLQADGEEEEAKDKGEACKATISQEKLQLGDTPAIKVKYI